MRRQDRYILNGALFVGGIAAFYDLIRQKNELNINGARLMLQNFDRMRIFKTFVGWAAAGAGLGYCFYCDKVLQEEELPFSADKYLKNVLEEEHLKADPADFRRAVALFKKVKQYLAEEFKYELAGPPVEAGSFGKRIAIGSNYDLDIVLPFDKYAYRTLEEMHYDVYETLRIKFKGVAIITKQKKSIRLVFESKGIPVYFDIVPGREINNYKVDKKLKLYVRPDWIGQKASSFKINVRLQKEMTVNKPAARKVIKLLKTYKDRNDLPLPTPLIEQCVTSALSENNFGVYHSLVENLLNCMDFVAKRLEQTSLRDMANSNNNLLDKLGHYKKICIAEQLQKDIMRIEENPGYVKDIFDC